MRVTGFLLTGYAPSREDNRETGEGCGGENVHLGLLDLQVGHESQAPHDRTGEPAHHRLRDTRVYEPQIRARIGTTVPHGDLTGGEMAEIAS